MADSAGTATALLSGVKTLYGVIGMDNSITRKVCQPEIYEDAKLKGMLHWALEAGKETGKFDS